MSAGPDGPTRTGWGVVLPLLPALLAPPAVFAAFSLGGRLLLPLLATLAVYPPFAGLVMRGRRAAAIVSALLWAASLSVSIIMMTARDPGRAGAVVLNGEAYRDELFAFIAAGAGRESDPARFVPQHALHLGLFAAATLVSGGLLGLAMGAVLLGYMSFYVGSLLAGPAPLLAALFGWPPWATARVVAFILLGALLSRPLLARLGRRPIPSQHERRIYLAAVALLILDVALKALLAARWAALLRPCLGAS